MPIKRHKIIPIQSNFCPRCKQESWDLWEGPLGLYRICSNCGYDSR